MTGTSQPVRGRLIRSPRSYDVLVWLLLRGKTRRHQEQILDIAHVAKGQSVLDIGCGTGTLAIAASERVGATGKSRGIDASPEMVRHARIKAAKAKSHAVFAEATVEDLPFSDGEFDRVLCTMMLHHTPRAAREQCMREMRRVLKPGGSALIVEFGADGTSLIERLHRHGTLTQNYVRELLDSAGFVIAETGRVGKQALYFIRATV